MAVKTERQINRDPAQRVGWCLTALSAPIGYIVHIKYNIVQSRGKHTVTETK